MKYLAPMHAGFRHVSCSFGVAHPKDVLAGEGSVVVICGETVTPDSILDKDTM